MRFYGMRSGRNNIPRLLARSYMYNYKKTSGNQHKSNKTGDQERLTKLQNNVIKAQNNLEKAIFREQQTKMADQMSKDIAEKYEQYFAMSRKEYLHEDVFDLRNLKSEYQKTDFIYDEPIPVMGNPIVEQVILLDVPKETFFERIFPSLREKRISSINENNQRIQCITDKNKQHEIDEIEKYNELECAYKIKMEEALFLWKQKEEKLKLEILEENKMIDDWIAACENDDSNAIMDFIETMLSMKDLEYDTLINTEILYNKDIDKIVIDLHMKKRDEIFCADGYTFMPRNEEIRAVKMKVSMANEMFRKLLIELCLHTFILLFKNAFSEKFKIITVNIYSENICYASSSIDKDSYDAYNLSVLKEKDDFVTKHINLFNKFNKGITAIETLFVPVKENI